MSDRRSRSGERSPRPRPIARIETLQWVIGALCALLGALLLVAPHRFQAPASPLATSWRLLWGPTAVLAGGGLLIVAMLRPPRRWQLGVHLSAAAALLALAASFAVDRIWVAAGAYVLLGVGTALAGWARRLPPELPAPDLFAVLMAAVALLNGAALLWWPQLTRSPYFDHVRGRLPLLGVWLLLGGVALGWAQLAPRAGRRPAWAAHLLAGGAFFAFGALVSLPRFAWTAVGVNWGYAAVLASLPWLAPRLARAEPSSLRARVALVLATVTSLTLIATAALATWQSERLVRRLARAEQRVEAAAPASAAVERALATVGGGAADDDGDPALDGVRRARDTAFVLLLVLLPAAIGGGTLLAGRLARPLTALEREVTALTAGDPSGELPRPPATQVREVVRLAASFAELRARLAERTRESERLAAELRARAEALAESDRRKDEFLAMLGHELRNPLGAIASSSALLGELAGGDPRLGRPLVIIQRQVEQLTHLVDDLLDVSRIARGTIALRRRPVDLREVVGATTDALRPLFAAKELALRVSVDGAALTLEADPTRLEQVIANLLRNAAKYTPRGGHVEVTARRSGDEVVLVVRDDGAGIAAEQLPLIFDLFYQAGEGRARTTGGGLGLGLTLVRRLVELHGGRVGARSGGLGCGTEVEIRLPLLAAPGTPAVGG